MRRVLAAMILVTAIATLAPSAANASWQSVGSGSGYSRAQTMPAGNTPTATVSGRNATASWTASSGSVSVTGYVVKRYDTSGSQQTIGASCSGTIAATTCTETAVPAGSWKYAVSPVHDNWRGAESAQSTTVVVGSPTLT